MASIIIKDMDITEGLLLVSFLVCINFLVNHLKEFSCSMQSLLSDTILVKHGFNIVAIFFALVLFSRYNAMPPHIIIAITFAMYVIFLLLMRCDYRFVLLFIATMLVVFYIEAEKNYRYSRKIIHDEEKKKLTRIQLALQCASLVFVVIGVVIYIGQHSREFKKGWSWFKFWFGSSECTGDGFPIKKTMFGDITDGIKRIVK